MFIQKIDKWSVNCLDDSNLGGTVAQQLNEVHGLNNISTSIVKVLCFIKSLQLQPNFDNVTCEYLCYWPSNKISNDLSNKEYFSSVIDLLYGKLGDIYNENRCQDIIFQINSTDFQKLKDVYDYKKNYNTIRGAIRDYVNEYSEKFRDYLDKSYESYEELYTKLAVQEERDLGAPGGQINARGVDDIRGSLYGYLVSHAHMVDGLSDKASVRSNIGVSDTFVGIFFPLVFTPIGSMIQSFLKKMLIIAHNMDDIGTQEINDNFSDYE
ncbi:PIR Superfamily Protein [Plasmodium ovale curtisi]|uniref:PIR Superfamily Protein n=1 Tax=Plasmodium ovale curtisi TaxID=864141 RepID=A0A1A8X0U5_PLAOA|nr:PIR Superfamily Protein [Plasmodium ovale curtisi]SBS98864.1 PIR Superfamily Protein [Plasmodium ovale curtisi]